MDDTKYFSISVMRILSQAPLELAVNYERSLTNKFLGNGYCVVDSFKPFMLPSQTFSADSGDNIESVGYRLGLFFLFKHECRLRAYTVYVLYIR